MYYNISADYVTDLAATTSTNLETTEFTTSLTAIKIVVPIACFAAVVAVAVCFLGVKFRLRISHIIHKWASSNRQPHQEEDPSSSGEVVTGKHTTYISLGFSLFANAVRSYYIWTCRATPRVNASPLHTSSMR